MLEMALSYGQALFSIASENDYIVSMQKEIKQIKELLKDNPEFLSILNSYFLTKEEKREIIDKTFLNVSDVVVSFLKVILDNNRMKYLVEILDSFNTLCNEYLGILEGLVYSIEPLDKKYIQQIEDTISKKEGVSVELKNIIDKSLIGGLKVVISDRVYDDSIKYHLSQMKSTLLK